jgi:hypothetical protein
LPPFVSIGETSPRLDKRTFYPQIYYLCALQFFFVSGVLPYSVSAMFPYCAAESIERDVISSRRSLGGEPLSA